MMRAIQTIAFFLSLVMPILSQAADFEELDVNKQRYSALQIIQEIQASDKESYLKDDLLVGKSLCAEIKRSTISVIEKFEAEVCAINAILQNEKSVLVQNWSVQYYPEEDKVCGRRAPVRGIRF